MLLRQRAVAFASALVLVVFTVCLVTRSDGYNNSIWSFAGRTPRPASEHQQNDSAQSFVTWARVNLPNRFEYRRQCFVARPKTNGTRSSLQHIPMPLVGTEGVDLSMTVESMLDGVAPCHSPISVDVPQFRQHDTPDTSSLMLGMATTLDRITASVPELSRWLANTGSPLLVLLVDQIDIASIALELQDVVSTAAQLGISLQFEPYTGNSSDSEGLKNFALARALNKNIQPLTEWFGLIDDDTFFVSLSRALDSLNAFDHRLPWYLGALTEGHTRLKQEGWKAWGGAGFFVSPPLMSILAANSEHCRTLDSGFGDTLWRDCIMATTSPTVSLTEMEGLHQIDMWGDISGFYESGLNPLLTIHHWKSWHIHPIANAHLVTDVAGPDTFLQRYSFTDGFILTNGFSVAQYPNGVPNLALAELTMVEDVGVYQLPDKLEFHRSMGPMRPALVLGKDKIQWKFLHSFNDGSGTVRQFYYKSADPKIAASRHSVLEIDWTRG